MDSKEYREKLTLLEAAVPKHPLLGTLRKGHSRINELYLKKAMDSIPEKKDAPIVIGGALEDDPIWKAMMVTRSNLFIERAKASNQFHQCKNDKERLAVSEEVQRWQGQIEVHFQKMRHYQEFGSLPSNKEEERFPLPAEPIALQKKLLSIRSNISMIKKELDDLFDKRGDKNRIEKLEKRLSHYQNYLAYATKRLKAHEGTE